MVRGKTASPVLQITKLVYEVSEEDVTRARNQLKASILFSMDGSGGASLCCGRLATVFSSLCARHTSQKLLGTSDLHECYSTIPACNDAAAVAEDIGRGLLVYGRRIPKAEIFARLDAVNAETIKVNMLGELPTTC